MEDQLTRLEFLLEEDLQIGLHALPQRDLHALPQRGLHALPADVFCVVISGGTLSLELAGQVDGLLLYEGGRGRGRGFLVERVEADVLAGGSFKFLGVVVGRSLLGGAVFLVIYVEVLFFGLLVSSALVVVEDGGVEFVGFFVLLVGCFQSIQQAF